MSRSGSLPMLTPGHKGLYEVSTGFVAVRGSPSPECESVGILRGGHRFYAMPYRCGSSTWLKVENADVAPPLFSPKAMGTRAPSEDTCKMYSQATPSLWHHHPHIHHAEETWVLNDAQSICFVREGRPESGRRRPLSGSVSAGSLSGSMSSPMSPALKVNLESIQTGPRHAPLETLPPPRVQSTGRFAKVRQRQPAITSKQHWASQHGAAWTNFRSFGVAGGPSSTNTGRWRQMGSD